MFKIGDALPSDSSVAIFVTALSAALNDLVMVNGLLLRSDEEDGPVAERLYLLRLSFSHLHELRATIKHAADDEQVKAFVDGLPDQVRANLDLVNDLNTPEDDWIEDAVRYVRNKTFHYYSRDRKDLAWAMSTAAGLGGEIEWASPVPSEMRLQFADQILNQQLARKFPEYKDPNADPDDDALARPTTALFKRISDATSAAIEFTLLAAWLYLDGLPDGVVEVVERH